MIGGKGALVDLEHRLQEHSGAGQVSHFVHEGRQVLTGAQKVQSFGGPCAFITLEHGLQERACARQVAHRPHRDSQILSGAQADRMISGQSARVVRRDQRQGLAECGGHACVSGRGPEIEETVRDALAVFSADSFLEHGKDGLQNLAGLLQVTLPEQDVCQAQCLFSRGRSFVRGLRFGGCDQVKREAAHGAVSILGPGDENRESIADFHVELQVRRGSAAGVVVLGGQSVYTRLFDAQSEVEPGPRPNVQVAFELRYVVEAQRFVRREFERDLTVERRGPKPLVRLRRRDQAE